MPTGGERRRPARSAERRRRAPYRPLRLPRGAACLQLAGHAEQLDRDGRRPSPEQLVELNAYGDIAKGGAGQAAVRSTSTGMMARPISLLRKRLGNSVKWRRPGTRCPPSTAARTRSAASTVRWASASFSVLALTATSSRSGTLATTRPSLSRSIIAQYQTLYIYPSRAEQQSAPRDATLHASDEADNRSRGTADEATGKPQEDQAARSADASSMLSGEDAGRLRGEEG